MQEEAGRAAGVHPEVKDGGGRSQACSLSAGGSLK